MEIVKRISSGGQSLRYSATLHLRGATWIQYYMKGPPDNSAGGVCVLLWKGFSPLRAVYQKAVKEGR